jgi:hypothetical protein
MCLPRGVIFFCVEAQAWRDPSRKIRAAGCRPIALDETAKLPVRKEADQLRKDGAALIQWAIVCRPRRPNQALDVSNRGKLETDSTHYHRSAGAAIAPQTGNRPLNHLG